MLKIHIKSLLFGMKGEYKPREFWDSWAHDFIKDPWQTKIHPQHKWLLKTIEKENPKSILEVGCGFGRNIKFLIENGISPSKISGFDISSDMIRQAYKYIKDKRVRFSTADLIDFKTKKKFDLVFTHGVLMHIPEDRIKDAINRLVKLTKRGLILIEQNYPANNNYTFTHNYRDLLSSRKIDIIEYRSDKKLGLDLIYAKVR